MLKSQIKKKNINKQTNKQTNNHNLLTRKLRWTCQETNKSKCKQREYHIIPKLKAKELQIKVPTLRIPFDHQVVKTSKQYFYNINLSFDTYKGIKPLSKCNLNANANTNHNTNPNYKDIFYHKIQELDNQIKRTLANNSKKMFKRSLSYQEVNDLYVHSVVKEYFRYPQSDLFQLILKCTNSRPIKPECAVYNSNGKKSRASIQRILRRGSKFNLIIQLKYILVKLPPKNILIGKILTESTSYKRVDSVGLIRYSRRILSSNKYYIRPKWEIKNITIDKLSNRKTNTIEPSTLEPFYAFLSDSE